MNVLRTRAAFSLYNAQYKCVIIIIQNVCICPWRSFYNYIYMKQETLCLKIGSKWKHMFSSPVIWKLHQLTPESIDIVFIHNLACG